MCYHENTLVIVLAASRSPADCKEDTKEDINWSLTNYLMSGSETVKCVTQTRNADHSPSKEKSCALPWQRSRYLVYVILFFFFYSFTIALGLVCKCLHTTWHLPWKLLVITITHK